MQKGRHEGLQEGKLAIASKLKKQGAPAAQIAEAAGLSVDEIAAL
jgi:predicted transposase/invertase (TIGR01784 family)